MAREKIGIIGLGKMGLNIALNSVSKNHEVVGYDESEEARINASENNILVKNTLEDLLKELPDKKVIWVMVPSGNPTENVVNDLIIKLKKDDIIIDAGNSFYKDSIRRAKLAASNGIKYLDVGTSGGISGAKNGACLMIGGDEDSYKYLQKFFEDISWDSGCLYTGESGSGHFLKMVHNGIEYGMMQSIAEGFDILEKSDFNYNLEKVAENWNNGSVIRSWLIELAKEEFKKDPQLQKIKGVVDTSGEAKWTVETALDMEVAIPVITLSLMMRNKSKDTDNFSGKVLSALRNGFGGHSIEYK